MAINLEMMKQLLAEFSEKEALTTEEIRAVQEQTKELEQRIMQCHERLKLVSEDKVRISEMMKRYAGVNGLSSTPSSSPVSAPAPKPERPTPSLGPTPAVSKPAVVQAPPPVPTVSSPPSSASPAANPAASPPSFFEDMPPPPPPKAPDAPVPFASAHDLVSSLSAATEPASPAPAPAPAPEPPATPAEEHDEHADDTVKSINDALRGLFR